MFPGPLESSLAGIALEKKIWELETVDIRSFASDKHNTVDETPYGGGPGMVLRPDVLGAAIETTKKKTKMNLPFIYLSPRGKRLNQERVRALSEGPGAVVICGRFEGIDERILSLYEIEELSIGDYVLSGGEPAAIVLLDSIIRLLPDVTGDKNSLTEESFEQGLLEYPQYTRPRDWGGLQVPEILLSGDHEKIRLWRKEKAEQVTRERRPDIWQTYKEFNHR